MIRNDHNRVSKDRSSVSNLYRNLDRKELLPKSPWFREPLAQFIGKKVTIEVPYYSIAWMSDSAAKLYLLDPIVMASDQSFDPLQGNNRFDHLKMTVQRKINPMKPLRIIGYAYSYVRNLHGVHIWNIGIAPIYVSQRCWYLNQDLPYGAVSVYSDVIFLVVSGFIFYRVLIKTSEKISAFSCGDSCLRRPF